MNDPRSLDFWEKSQKKKKDKINKEMEEGMILRVLGENRHRD